MAAGGCATDDSTRLESWVDTARDAVAASAPTSDTMQIDPSAACGLVDEIEIGGRQPDLFGAGTAFIGEIGSRYQCAWSGDANGSANVRLEVALIDEPSDYADYTASFTQRDGNVTVPTDIGDVEVATFIPDSGRPVTTSLVAVPDEQAGIHLVVELLDSDDLDTWTAVDHAELLAQLAS